MALLLPTPDYPNAETVNDTMAEPVVLRQFQDFSDLPGVQLRKGIDDDGNPWTPDLLLAEGPADPQVLPSDWARKRFAGKAFDKDFTGSEGILERISSGVKDPFWVIRAENLQSKRKLVTVRLFAVPAGYEDDAMAWTPVDKFLVEIEARQQAAIARKMNLNTLFDAWTRRSYFRDMDFPTSLESAAGNPVWIFTGVLITDAAVDHPENVCHCGSVQACQATVDGLDRRDPRYPFDKIFRHSIRTTIPLLKPTGMRIYLLG